MIGICIDLGISLIRGGNLKKKTVCYAFTGIIRLMWSNSKWMSGTKSAKINIQKWYDAIRLSQIFLIYNAMYEFDMTSLETALDKDRIWLLLKIFSDIKNHTMALRDQLYLVEIWRIWLTCSYSIPSVKLFTWNCLHLKT